MKKSPKFYDLKKSVRKHFKEAVKILKSKIGQFMPSCSSNKLQKHKRDTHSKKFDKQFVEKIGEKSWKNCAKNFRKNFDKQFVGKIVQKKFE